MTPACFDPGAGPGTAARVVAGRWAGLAAAGRLSPGNQLSGMRNAEIAAALRQLGVLYELDGPDRFRVQAYREAARTVAESPVSIEQLAEEGRLTERAAIGRSLAEKIETLIETGSIPSADKLKAKLPATLVE